MERRIFIETKDGRVFDFDEFRGFDLIQRRMDGDWEIVGFSRDLVDNSNPNERPKPQAVNLATFQNKSDADTEWEEFKRYLGRYATVLSFLDVFNAPEETDATTE